MHLVAIHEITSQRIADRHRRADRARLADELAGHRRLTAPVQRVWAAVVSLLRLS